MAAFFAYFLWASDTVVKFAGAASEAFQFAATGSTAHCQPLVPAAAAGVASG